MLGHIMLMSPRLSPGWTKRILPYGTNWSFLITEKERNVKIRLWMFSKSGWWTLTKEEVPE